MKVHFFGLLLVLMVNNVIASNINMPVLEAYAKHAQYIDIKLSPGGEYLAATSRDIEGVISLTVLDLRSNEVISITRGRGNESVSSFSWLNDERLLLTMAREVGSLEKPLPTGELIAMNADGKKMVILTGPRAATKDYRFSSIIDILPNEPEQVLIYSVSWSSSEPFIDLYRMKVSTGRKKGLGRIPMRAYKGSGVGVFSNKKGEVLAAQGIDPSKNNKLILLARNNVDSDWKSVLESYEYEGSFSPLYFLDDDETLIGISDLETDTKAMATFNIKTRKHKVLISHDKADLSPIISIANGVRGELIGARYQYEQLGSIFLNIVKDKKNQAIIKSLLKSFPGQAVRITSATKDNKSMVVMTSSANNPPKFYLYDNVKRKLSVLTPTKPWLNKDIVSETTIITYKSRDGLEITGLLTLPKGKSKNLPLILLPHGGPHGVKDDISYINADVKVLSYHGYAVFQPNFRGSGGFGRSFLTSGFRKWGTEMINDMTDGVHSLIKNGVADKERICVYGASYGGYAALQSVINEPDLYKCSIGFVGVYDLDLMFEEGDIPENQSGINFLNQVLPIGESRKAQSPVHNIDKIKVPVFIVQGEDDVRVPKEHAFRLRKGLEKENSPYEWMMKSGEGHGFYKPENQIELWQEMLQFLNKHIGH
ncbi:S9 family peptidase [Pseudoalteromonas sp. NEC-BIFX-2020_015]|uniref:alpha/beta hydrolase family protein n=1 Tax=Pseudoalteromonas sp. NEC-BIFX-2020_015 TaxID=2729544 RepID=UPI0014616C0A|nr:S9 family peptidase [Pseudoalteromonas sp. NEC-BIFX-2020_015]NMR25273.1 S9 family peptidase [Pseudoalteromonas sp. NEC-BIFX-2020_015]